MGRRLWSLVWAEDAPPVPTAPPPSPAPAAPPPQPALQPTAADFAHVADFGEDDSMPPLVAAGEGSDDGSLPPAQRPRLPTSRQLEHLRAQAELVRAWPGWTSRAERLPSDQQAMFAARWVQQNEAQPQATGAPSATVTPTPRPPSPTNSARLRAGRDSPTALGRRREPSPPRQNVVTPGWDDWIGDFGVPDLPSRWTYDAHPDHNGWNASAEGHAAALILSAVYRQQRPVNGAVPVLDMRWHRPEQHEANPFGYNQRGDLAPAVAHDTLTDVLRGKALTPLEVVLLHNWLDSVWLRHSRSEGRCTEVVRRLELFDEREVGLLVRAMHAEPLTDFRVLLHSIDPREQPVYGRTLDGEGESRLFRMFPAALARRDTAAWDEDDGGMTGSSRESSDDERPYSLTAEQRLEQRLRHVERRARRAVPRAEAVESAMDRVEERLRDLETTLPQAEAAIAVLRRGVNAPPEAESRACVWEGWS